MKPYVICHMMPSIDGRLRTDRWNIPDAAHEEYDRTADTYRAQAWLCGRVTMEEFANGRWRRPAGRRSVRVEKGDWIAPRSARRLAVVLDSAGKLAWKKNEVEGDALVIVLTEAAPAAYLSYLRDKEISYVVAGRRDGEINLAAVVRRLGEKFGVKRLLVEGGGKTTGAFLAAGLIDEISLLLTPVADGRIGEPSLFDTEGNHSSKALSNVRIQSVRKIGAGMFWLKARPSR
ncbi:MAG: bifunctional deaminase-reductase domain protein [Verrucomicrobia bacterium]|nr:bifunctional deaminase-reductase domain protein [Verrucomicrobiota bacterium]